MRLETRILLETKMHQEIKLDRFKQGTIIRQIPEQEQATEQKDQLALKEMTTQVKKGLLTQGHALQKVAQIEVQEAQVHQKQKNRIVLLVAGIDK